jgi:universal stress protein E
MTTAIFKHRTVSASHFHRQWMPERTPLLVATDGTESADSALRAAHAIAARTGQSVTLLAVQEPLPVVAAEVQIAMSPRVEAESRATMRAQVDDQVERLHLDTTWPLRIITGDPAATIVSVAKDIGASLVIMGMGERGLFGRLLGDETVIKVLRLGTVPVLAVAPDFEYLPTRVLAAVDFSASSGRALRLAGQVTARGCRLTMAHVITRAIDPLNWTARDAGYGGTVGYAFNRMVAEAGLAEATVVDRRMLRGDPADELVRLADELHPELIIAGSHGQNFLTRLLIGSVSTQLVRKAPCSVLVAPPDDAPGYIEEMPEVRGRFAFYEWAERLEEFTRRNSGRFARLEVIDPEIGAQLQENHVPFQGASFDPRDGRVQLMFESANGHLTRSIGGVTGIQMLRDRNGKDAFLRVAHGRGQTLLTLER